MKILLAEDDSSIQAIARLALTRVGHHDVVCASDGIEVLKTVKVNKFDLILLDVMMPRLDGFETCVRLKADDTSRDTPIIFLTAKAQMAEIQHGMSLGAIGYILKPFDPMTLSAQVQEILDHGSKA